MSELLRDKAVTLRHSVHCYSAWQIVRLCVNLWLVSLLATTQIILIFPYKTGDYITGDRAVAITPYSAWSFLSFLPVFLCTFTPQAGQNPGSGALNLVRFSLLCDNNWSVTLLKLQFYAILPIMRLNHISPVSYTHLTLPTILRV